VVSQFRDNELVETYEQVLANVRQFNRELDERNEDILFQLSQFKQWYFIPQLDMFGPSKYIGYKDMNATFYNRGRRLPGQTVQKDGRVTERPLSKWFIKVDESSDLAVKLRGKLERRLYPLGKVPQRGCHFHVPRCEPR